MSDNPSRLPRSLVEAIVLSAAWLLSTEVAFAQVQPIPAGQSLARESADAVDEVNLAGMSVKEVVAGVAVIASVSPNTAAAAAGIRPGDVLVSVSDHAAIPLKELMTFAVTLVRGAKPGTIVPTQIMRDGITQRIDLLIRGPASTQATEPPSDSAPLPLNAASMVGLSLSETAAGSTVIREVRPNSAAAVGGLLPGDVIVAADGIAIQSAPQLSGLIELAHFGDRMEMRIQRQGSSILTPIQIQPRIGELANLGANRAISIAEPGLKAMQQEIDALRRDVQSLIQEVNRLNQAAAPNPSVSPSKSAK